MTEFFLIDFMISSHLISFHIFLISHYYLTLFDVKHAAQLSVGPSVNCITVARIFKLPKLGASTEINVPSDVPVANPLGKSLTVFIYAKYSSTVGNSGNVSGVSDVIVVAVVADRLLLALLLLIIDRCCCS
jgi:hypothetical protein